MSASPFDDVLDDRLNDVPLPAGLLTRLRGVPLTEDGDLDHALTDVRMPATLTPLLATIAYNRRHWRAPLPQAAASLLPQAAVSLVPQAASLLPQAAAALLVFAASLGYALSAVAFVCGRFEVYSGSDSALVSSVSVLERGEAWLAPYPARLEPPAIEISVPTLEEGNLNAAIDVARSYRSATMRINAAEQVVMAGGLGETHFWSPAGRALYDFETIDRPTVGLANPRALDCRIWRQTGMLPWLSVEENQHVHLPLVQSDRSYRLARQRIQSGRLPAAAEIRCEEFIVGIEYGIGLKEPAQSLFMAAAPSPFAQLGRGGTLDSEAAKRWLLMAAVKMPSENSQRQAFGARLNFEFSRECVAEYRLIGYSPPPDSTANDVQREADEGERAPARRDAVVLFEIELRPGYQRQDELVRVALESVADNSAPHARSKTMRATLRAEALSPDFDSAPIIWRQAALAALAAERLAESPYCGLSLGEIAALAREIEPLVYDRPGWQELIVMLVRAQSLQSSLLREF